MDSMIKSNITGPGSVDMWSRTEPSKLTLMNPELRSGFSNPYRLQLDEGGVGVFPGYQVQGSGHQGFHQNCVQGSGHQQRKCHQPPEPFLGGPSCWSSEPEIRLDIRIPPKRYYSFTRELYEMALAYHREGNPRRAAEHYSKLIVLCETMRRNGEFWERVSTVEKDRLIERQKEAIKSLERYWGGRMPWGGPGNKTPGQQALRTLVIPTKVVDAFLSCWSGDVGFKGVLAGSVRSDTFVVTHLFVPGDKEIPMLTLGWVHVHPSSEPFLSAQDVSVQYCYQSFLPEAVAVVCALGRRVSRAFRLTLQGLRALASAPVNCFSPPELYSEAPHCVLDPFSNITFVDLRLKMRSSMTNNGMRNGNVVAHYPRGSQSNSCSANSHSSGCNNNQKS